MQIKRVRPTVFQLTLHAYELASMMAAIRWIVEGAEGELTEDARGQLQKLLQDYNISQHAEASKSSESS